MTAMEGGRKIAIAGAGMTGAYLYRLLTRAGRKVDIYDEAKSTRCGLSPCAWGTSRDFHRLVAGAGLSPRDYLLKEMESVTVDDIPVRGELFTFDKPRLVRDLLGDASVRLQAVPPGVYDRIIDATGVSRALLPPVENDVVLDCSQYLVETETDLGNRVRLAGIGYAWCFPVSPARYHVGCGCLLEDPREVLRRLGWLRGPGTKRHRGIICGCQGKIRLTGPHHCLPFVAVKDRSEIWGIGEAIGCVAPLVGDGIVPGMRSVEVLVENWDDPLSYRQAVLKEFRWMEEERGVFDTLKAGKRVGMREALVLVRNSRRMKLQLGIGEVTGLLKALAYNYLTGGALGEPTAALVQARRDLWR